MRTTFCAECDYLREERSCIHEFDGKLSREDADRLALIEFCPLHQPQPEQQELIV